MDDMQITPKEKMKWDLEYLLVGYTIDISAFDSLILMSDKDDKERLEGLKKRKRELEELKMITEHKLDVLARISSGPKEG